MGVWDVVYIYIERERERDNHLLLWYPGFIPRQTGRLTVDRNITLTLTGSSSCRGGVEYLHRVLDLVTEVKRKVSCRRPRPELGCRAKGKRWCQLKERTLFKILSHMSDSRRGFGLDIEFSDHLLIVTTSYYNSLTELDIPNITIIAAYIKSSLPSRDASW
jgi:hypothetical protein